MTDDERAVPDLAAQIARADEGRQKGEPPLPEGRWARLVERDRRDRARSSPNAVGGFANILYPWRLYIAIGGAVVVVVLVVLSLLG